MRQTPRGDYKPSSLCQKTRNKIKARRPEPYHGAKPTSLFPSRSVYKRQLRSRQASPRNGPNPASFWWSRTGSNRRPPACKAGALPAELRPLIRMVGLGRLELPTSRLSSARSNQLSYRPIYRRRVPGTSGDQNHLWAYSLTHRPKSLQTTISMEGMRGRRHAPFRRLFICKVWPRGQEQKLLDSRPSLERR